MFTLAQINSAHAKVKTGADFPRYVQEIKALGLAHYDYYVADGHAEYFSLDGQCIHSPAKHPSVTIAQTANPEVLRHTIAIHQKGQTDFATFCNQAATAGVLYWRTDAMNLSCIYRDVNGNEIVREPIPDAGYTD